MARISPKNPRYRTKQELAEDVVNVLNSDLHYGTKFAVVREVAWVWTEYLGKFNGCIYWSDAAVRRFKREHSRKRLRHEHVVPKKFVIDMLFGLKTPTVEEVRAILDKYLIGVVVTMEEDALLNVKYSKAMPKEFSEQSSPLFQDPWLRYRECGIKVRAMSHQRAAILKPFSKVVLQNTVNESALRKLEKAVYRHGWIDSDFDWGKWNEAEEYVVATDKLDTADIFLVRKLLTTHFRKERMCEGHLNEMIANGHFKQIFRRLKKLRICRAFE